MIEQTPTPGLSNTLSVMLVGRRLHAVLALTLVSNVRETCDSLAGTARGTLTELLDPPVQRKFHLLCRGLKSDVKLSLTLREVRLQFSPFLCQID